MPICLPEGFVPAFIRLTRRNKTYVTGKGARRRIRERALRPKTYGPPASLRGVRVTRRADESVPWPIYDIEPCRRSPRALGASVVIYVHGGGWVGEISGQHWRLAARIARETRQRVVVPIYPLVPFGTAREVRDGIIRLVRQEMSEGREVRLAGDSAGGQIALSVALALRDEGVALAATTLISPALDLTWSNPLIDAVQPSDPWLARPGGRVLAEAWRGGDGIVDPVVSPLFGELSGLGPLAILTGTRDILNPDAQVLRDRARSAGVPVVWHEEPGQLHVYPLPPTATGERGARAVVESLRPQRSR